MNIYTKVFTWRNKLCKLRKRKIIRFKTESDPVKVFKIQSILTGLLF